MSNEFDTFDDFADKAKQLFAEAPDRTRLVVKYRHAKGMLYVRATDDRVCLKYYSDQATDVRKLEKLNAWVLAHILEVGEAEDEGMGGGVLDSEGSNSSLSAANKKRRRKGGHKK